MIKQTSKIEKNCQIVEESWHEVRLLTDDRTKSATYKTVKWHRHNDLKYKHQTGNWKQVLGRNGSTLTYKKKCNFRL